MSRSLHANIIAELPKPFLLPLLFADLQFDSGNIRLHDDLGDVIWGGFTWSGTGDLGSVGPIKESDKLIPSGITLSLSGIDSGLLDEARNQDYQDRPIVLYIGMRNTITGALVSDPTEIFYGFMDQMKINTGRKTSTISMQCESEQKRWEQAPTEYYDDATLQTDFSGDLFFEFLPDMVNLKLDWGTNVAVLLPTGDPTRDPRNERQQ